MTEKEHIQNVKQVQNALHLIHKSGKNIPMVHADGIFGDETEKAVKSYQSQSGLKPTGEVDYETWEKIMDEATENIDKIVPVLPITPFVSDETSMAKPGEHKWSVFFAQMMLNVISVKYSGFDGVCIDGTNDEKTAAALCNIQKAAGIENVDGTLEKRTWNALATMFEFVI